MDITYSSKPKEVLDETIASCSNCNSPIYIEKIIATLNEDGTYSHVKYVEGTFKQAVDLTGLETGPVIPYCKCNQEETNNA